MKSAIGLWFITALTLTGCAGLLAKQESSVPPASAPCVVQYVRILPQMWLGQDGCGHSWVAVPADSAGNPKCLYWSEEDGVLMEIQCPSPGDTLGS